MGGSVASSMGPWYSLPETRTGRPVVIHRTAHAQIRWTGAQKCISTVRIP